MSAAGVTGTEEDAGFASETDAAGSPPPPRSPPPRSPPPPPHALSPHVTTSPDRNAAAVAYLPAATITACGFSTPARVRSTSRATPWRHAAPPWHGAPGSAASADAACFAQEQSPPESQEQSPLDAAPATPARPSWPRSFRPKVCTPPRAVTAAVWYRPQEAWTKTAGGRAGSGATGEAAVGLRGPAGRRRARGRSVAAAAGAVVASGGVEGADVGDEGGVTGGGGPDDGLVRGDALDRRGGHGPRVRGATQAIAADAPRHGARAAGAAAGRSGSRSRPRVEDEGRRGGGRGGVASTASRRATRRPDATARRGPRTRAGPREPIDAGGRRASAWSPRSGSGNEEGTSPRARWRRRTPQKRAQPKGLAGAHGGARGVVAPRRVTYARADWAYLGVAK